MEKEEVEKFMRMAIALSEQNVKQNLGGPFGAVIVKDGKVIAASANRVIPENDPTAHAEVSAIRLACKESLRPTPLSGAAHSTSSFHFSSRFPLDTERDILRRSLHKRCSRVWWKRFSPIT